jgi:hypothetical protein
MGESRDLAEAGPLRILFVTSCLINLLEDILHEGFDEVLGPENVFCFPYKDYEDFQYNLYPPDPTTPPHRPVTGYVRLMTAKEEIGAVVIGSGSVATWQLIQDEFTGVPVALIQELEGAWPTGVRYTHRFAKNLLPEEQASDLWPLPMAAPPRAMLAADVPRDIDLSFVVRRTDVFRALCAEALLQKGFCVLLGADLPREQFCWLLNRSKIAVSVRGSGWDTFRYWEIPYHGALLLSQRLPILIPDNFVDGTSAAFFDSPEEMVEKAQDLLTHPETLACIASAGRRLALEKHTAGARARYVLEKLGLAVPARPLGRHATGSGRVPVQ